MNYRDYQQKMHDEVLIAWQTHRNVCLVAPTGSGKTVLFSGILAAVNAPSVVIAHRQELVAQTSLALARNGLQHRIIAPANVVRNCCRIHALELGTCFYNPSAQVAVAGVDTIIRRPQDWYKTVKYWVTDESHHLTLGNKWAKAIDLFPQARGLGVTATPHRADGKGLDGVFSILVLGPTMGDLILQGHLSRFKIYAPPTSLDLGEVQRGADGDFKKPQLTLATEKAKLTGDIVSHYKKLANGLRGVTFAASIKLADELTEQYNAAGIPARTVHAKTPDLERRGAVTDLRSGKLLQLVNVDIFGEGFDLPAIEVVTFARATQSYGLYAQQFGRALRPSPGKSHAIIIDHVGNVMRHGLPTRSIAWSLKPRERKQDRESTVKIKTCLSCMSVYEGYSRKCPYCEHVSEVKERVTIEQVDGDLAELDLSTIDELHKQISKIDQDVNVKINKLRYSGASPIVINSAIKHHRATQHSQATLRHTMKTWSDAQPGDIRDKQVLFYKTYGIDVLTAQTLKRAEADKLNDKIQP